MISKTILLFSLVFLFGTAILVSDAYGAIYLKIDGIKGESTTNLKECTSPDRCIDLSSVQFGVGRAISSGGGSGDRESGVPSLSEITVTKQMDISSVPLFQESLTGKNKNIEIFITENTDGKIHVYAQYKPDSSLVSSYSMSSGGDRPSESISINFEKIETIVTPYDKDGKPLSPFQLCYDESLGKLCGTTPPPPTDSDGDGIPDTSDICPGFDDQLDTDSDGTPNGCDLDDDNDGISDTIDLQPTIASLDFSDGTSSGTITGGAQNLRISDAPGSKIKVVSSGPATISACGISNLTFTAGEVDFICGSITLQVISGSVDVTFTDINNIVGTTTLNTGDDITFDGTLFEFTNNGTTDVVVIVNGNPINITAGETIIDADGDGLPSTLDCNDNDDMIFPGSSEIANDGIDQNCDGKDLDTIPPVFDGTLIQDITKEATGPDGAIATYVLPTAQDAVDGSVIVVCSPVSGSVFALGENTVECTASDSSGNSSTESFRIFVEDTTSPFLVIPANVEVTFEGVLTTVDIGVATATDAVDSSPVISNNAPLQFPLGETLVTWTATDFSGNSDSQTQIVRVNGPQVTKENIITELEQLKTLSADKNNPKEFDKAIKNIKNSISSKLWVDQINLDPKKGDKVFKEESDAVQNLLKILGKSSDDKKPSKESPALLDNVQEIVNTLVDVDRLLAQNAIDNAQDSTGKKSDKFIQKANNMMVLAEKELGKGHFNKAIDRFDKAWSFAQQALKHDN